MQTVTTIGLDIAKSVFQVHGHDGAGQVVIRTRAVNHRIDPWHVWMPDDYLRTIEPLIGSS